MKDHPTEFGNAPAAPEPKIKMKSGPSIVWLIPLITAIIGGWLIVKTLTEKGPEITITFKTAEGIEAEKTKIQYKNIEIGMVESVYFSKDFSHVIIKAAMEKESAPFLRRDTRFWVVRPQLSLRGATGLSTLLSGAYIEIEPGQGAPQRRFVGLEVAPVVKADVAGKKIMLMAKELGSVDTGSPVYYQGILAGEILGWELGNDRKSIFIHAFIKAPYDELVQSNTRFWNVSGLDVSIGADGISVQTESIQSLLYGGIAFETPETLEKAKEDVEGLVFTLYDSLDTIREQAFTQKIKFILFFEGSVRGLSVGAPVEFKGIKVGSVTDVRLEFDNRDASFRIPVLIEIEPERVVARGEDKDASPYQILKNLVDRGLRAQLQTGSLLTGQLFIELDMHPETPIRLVNTEVPYPELPTIPAELAQMTTSVKNILAGLEKVDMEQIGTEMLASLQGANKLINNPALQASAKDLEESLIAFKSIMLKVDQRIEPITVNLEKAISAGHQALEKTQGTMSLIDEVLEPGSPFQYNLIKLTEELAEMARSIRILVDLLERNPNALIFGKDASGKTSGEK
ncbi:intermembrane transport protein PqiB [Thermodesulfobacteriota bacterium]